jgi:outer membrane protein OmpA-like peptidoglycan-associated protein
MRLGSKALGGVALVAGAMIVFTAPTPPVRAQPAAATGNLIDQLAGPETEPDIDLAALRQQAAQRIKSRADTPPLKRPPIAPELRKLPHYDFDVAFDPDASLIRPQSYGTIGRIADALSDPKLRPYAYLVIGHTDASGKRDANLALSQKRADSIRDVLVGTFKINAKRLQAIGLGEEQLQDAAHPASAVNLGAQIVAIGILPQAPAAETPATAAGAAKKPAAAKKKKH